MSPSTDKRSDPAELLGPVSGHMQRAVGIEVERAPGDFPQVAVWVGEVTRVTAPEGVSRRLDDLASGGRREREYLVHLMPLAHIMRQRYAGEPRARTVPARAHVRSQLMKRVERQRRPRGLEEDDAVFWLPGGRESEPVAVEPVRHGEVCDAEGNQRDTRFHGRKYGPRQ